MLKWIARRQIAAFERAYDYDMSYARQILDADFGAAFAFSRIRKMSEYKRDVPRDVYYAAKIVGTMVEDCGPCTQLAVTMALSDGVDAKTIIAVVSKDDAALSESVRLGVQFARAVLAHDLAADDLREQILRRWGPRALVSLAFVLVTARVYPTLKYALGHGKACTRVVVEGAPVLVPRTDSRHATAVSGGLRPEA
jgi:hypothetical protein